MIYSELGAIGEEVKEKIKNHWTRARARLGCRYIEMGACENRSDDLGVLWTNESKVGFMCLLVYGLHVCAFHLSCDVCEVRSELPILCSCLWVNTTKK